MESYGLYNECGGEEDCALDKFSVNKFERDYKIINNRFRVPSLRKPPEQYPSISTNIYPALNRHKSPQYRLRKSPTLGELYNDTIK